MKNYKPSMFNRIVEEDKSFIIYNSYKGVKNICRVSESKLEKIKKWLQSEFITESEDNDFKILMEMGYLVPIEYDEKLIRDMLYREKVTDNRLQLVIHTTKACNFRCSYCYLEFQSERMKQDIQEGIINFIRKNIQKYRAVNINWFGGEPLLQMDVIENISQKVIEICKKQKKPYISMVTTNGYLLTPENIEKLIKYNVTHIAVTIDGNKELHDSQRFLTDGSPTFNQIIKNLLYIRDCIKSRTLTISIRSNITQKHIPYLADYYSLFDKLFGNDSRFTLFIRPVADYGGERVQSMKKDFLNGMDTIYEHLISIQKGIKFHANFIDLEVGGYTCTAKKINKYTIGCDGSIHKCDESLEHPIGYLEKDGRLQLNQFKHAKWVQDIHKEECENCFFSSSCFMELCPKARVLYNSKQCPVNFKEIDSLIRLAAHTYMIKKI